MKTNVVIYTAKDIIDEFDLVVNKKVGDMVVEKTPDYHITYINKDGFLYEGTNCLMVPRDICDKIACNQYEVIEKNGQYALLIWKEN